MMNFTEYQEQASEFALYPAAPRTVEALMYCALGLTGEAGEVAEKIKKYFRDGKLNKDDVKKELGDVLWYLANLSKELDISLADVAYTNIMKLVDRRNRTMIQGSGDNR